MADTDTIEPWFPIESMLKNDAAGTERDALIDRLQEQAGALKKQMDAGMPQGEFARHASVYTALETASQLVTIIWGRYHRV